MWITATDLTNRLGSVRYVELLDDDGDGSADAGPLAEVLSAAEAEVNSYLAGRYNLAALATAAAGDANVAGLLRNVTLDVAEWRAEARRPLGVPESVTEKYKAAVRWLRDAADGRVSLASDAEIAEARQVQGQVGGNERVFTREQMEGL